MNSQAYCFACGKRVSALTILDKEGLWKALDSGADIEVMQTSDKGRSPRRESSATFLLSERTGTH